MGKVVLDDGVGGMSALLVGILRMKEDGIVQGIGQTSIHDRRSLTNKYSGSLLRKGGISALIHIKVALVVRVVGVVIGCGVLEYFVDLPQWPIDSLVI